MKVNAPTSGWRTARSRNKLGIEFSAHEVSNTDKTPPPCSLKACVGSSAVAGDLPTCCRARRAPLPSGCQTRRRRCSTLSLREDQAHDHTYWREDTRYFTHASHRQPLNRKIANSSKLAFAYTSCAAVGPEHVP